MRRCPAWCWIESRSSHSPRPHGVPMASLRLLRRALACRQGAFFEASTIPSGRDGDGYYMRYILHDWPTEEALAILRNVRTAIGSANATLLIGECALPDHDTIGVPPVMYQIDIQMMSAFGEAQERTPMQWQALLAQGGFELVGFHPTRSLVHWVEAKPI
mmetsp:Transcript_22244/g.70635  ORF Transcript_22244/g.70635 Transcript_22244/m.70635 type:complete len:160 (+) Transcript_22244:727-1206(+)